MTSQSLIDHLKQVRLQYIYSQAEKINQYKAELDSVLSSNEFRDFVGKLIDKGQTIFYLNQLGKEYPVITLLPNAYLLTKFADSGFITNIISGSPTIELPNQSNNPIVSFLIQRRKNYILNENSRVASDQIHALKLIKSRRFKLFLESGILQGQNSWKMSTMYRMFPIFSKVPIEFLISTFADLGFELTQESQEILITIPSEEI